MILILLYCLIKLSFNIYIYQPKELLDYLNENITKKENLIFIKDKLLRTFSDAYAYYELSKNPPQPKFDKNYHKKVDIKKEFDKIKTDKDRSFYSFYRDIKAIISDLRDGHTSINFNSSLKNIAFLSPLNLYIKLDNETPRIYGKPYLNKTLEKYFVNFETIFKIIRKNLDVPIKSINGKNPFNYINDYIKKYHDIRSPHGSFVFNYYTYNRLSLFLAPLSIKDATNFTVIYNNEDNFTTDYIFLSSIKIIPSKKEDIVLTKSENDFRNINKDLFINNNYIPEIKELPYKLITDPLDFQIEQKEIKEIKTIGKKTLKWDYNYNNIFYCRTDTKNNINVYFIKSFSSKNYEDYLDIIGKCSELFDKNNYPVILITNLNGGGVGLIAQYLLELLSPLLTVNIYISSRKTENIQKNFQGYYLEPKKCLLYESDYFLKDNITINYGNNVSETLISPNLFLSYYLRDKLNSFKSKLKNPRKPTDIMVFTDGFSFSATSLLIKYYQYYGGGITIGFFGNSNRTNIPFDSSLSPSAIFKKDHLVKLSPEGFKKLNEKYNITMQFAGKQSFYHPDNMTNPLEFEVTPVDEKINLYEFFNDFNYNKFVNHSKFIFERYKKYCNPNNKRLILVTKDCDKFFDDKFTHGGYECGDNGIWTNKCVPSYCDSGYIFNPKNKKCEFDYCYIYSSYFVNYKLYLLIFFVSILLSLIISIVFMIYICLKGMKKNIRKNSILLEDNIN